MTSPTGGERVFVGRVAEMRTLLASLDAARGGDGRVVFLVGDAGMGKTRTLEELARQSGLPDERILRARCPTQPGAPAYWPWIQVIRSHAAASPAAALREEIGLAAPDVAALLPELAATLAVDAPGPPPDASDPARFRLFDGIVRFLGRATRQAPLLLLIDDLHAADAASLALLDFLGRDIGRLRLLVAGAYRERELRDLPDAPVTVATLGPRIVLPGLAPDEVAELVAAHVGTMPSAAMTAEIHRATDGNPFLVGELARLLPPEGLDPSDLHTVLPDGVRAALRDRFATLAPAERAVLDTAAVIGREFELRTVELADGLEAGAALERLTRAVAIDVVTLDGPGTGRFASALLRDVLYGDLPPAARAQAHRRVARALEAQHADDADPPLAALADHFFRAAPLGESAKAVEYAHRAALRARERAAHAEAVAHLDRALLALGLGPADERSRTRLRLDLADARRRAGDEAGARELFRRVALGARAAGDAAAFADGAAGLAACIDHTWIVDEDSVRLLEEALAALPEADGPRRARTAALLVRALHFAPDSPRAQAAAREVRAQAERLADPAARGPALIGAHFLVRAPAAVAERRQLADAIVQAGEAAGDAAVALVGRRWSIVAALEVGDLGTVDRELEIYVRRTEASALMRARTHGERLLGMRAVLAGRLADAERHAERALALRPFDERSAVAPVHIGQLLTIRREQGRLAEIEPLVAAHAERPPSLPMWRALLALVQAELGQRAGPVQALDVLMAHGGADVPRDDNWIAQLAITTDIATTLRETDVVAPLATLLQPWADRMVLLGAGVVCWGSVAGRLGALAAVAGRLDEAETHFAAALAAHAGMPVLRAHTRVDLAGLLLRRGAAGDVERARAHLREAARVAGTLDLPRLAARAAALAETAPAPAASTSGAAATATIRCEGEFWAVSHAGTIVHLRDAKGLGYLVQLLRDPGREFHVLDLAAAGGGEGVSVGEAAEAGLRTADLGDAGELLDASARAAYRSRVAELRDELAEAERDRDVGRAERLREEMEFVANELARSLGLGGRSRKAGSVAERARVNVTRALATVIRKIAAGHPVLGQHLQATVHSGFFCSYAPDPRVPLRWEL